MFFCFRQIDSLLDEGFLILAVDVFLYELCKFSIQIFRKTNERGVFNEGKDVYMESPCLSMYIIIEKYTKLYSKSTPLQYYSKNI